MKRIIFAVGLLVAIPASKGQETGNTAAGNTAAGNAVVALRQADIALQASNLALQTSGIAFQTLGNPVLSNSRVLDEGFSSRIVKGKPFSATEERHSLQTLGDGTRIENLQTNRLYRDTDGRTRLEEMNGTVTIYDPVTATRIDLDPATKTARKQNGVGSSYNSVTTAVTTLGGYGVGTGYAFTTRPAANPANIQGVMSETTENLGTQQVNGVAAQGVRTTMIIPKGQIGNNKDIKVMTERWSSNDLQMQVKSVNSDPRFGETTYQLTKITQSAPDPGLFQIPSDYTVNEFVNAGRGRGAAPALKAVPAPASQPARGAGPK